MYTDTLGAKRTAITPETYSEEIDPGAELARHRPGMTAASAQAVLPPGSRHEAGLNGLIKLLGLCKPNLTSFPAVSLSWGAKPEVENFIYAGHRYLSSIQDEPGERFSIVYDREPH